MLFSDVKRISGYPATWLVLVALCIHAALPMALGKWALCIGCDGFGVAALQHQAPASGRDECCTHADAGANAGVAPDSGAIEVPAEDCECVLVSFDSKYHEAAVSGRSAERMSPAGPIAAAPPRWTPTPVATGPGQRGPPDHGWLGASLTLLGQRTLLLT